MKVHCRTLYFLIYILKAIMTRVKHSKSTQYKKYELCCFTGRKF